MTLHLDEPKCVDFLLKYFLFFHFIIFSVLYEWANQKKSIRTLICEKISTEFDAIVGVICFHISFCLHLTFAFLFLVALNDKTFNLSQAVFFLVFFSPFWYWMCGNWTDDSLYESNLPILRWIGHSFLQVLFFLRSTLIQM